MKTILKCALASALLCCVTVFAQTPATPPTDTTQAAPDSTNADGFVFSDIDIFANLTLGSIYVLWQNIDIDLNIKEQITSRNLAKDVFFMQNIDREQFEEGRALHLFTDQKKKFFQLFPEEEECEKTGECAM